MAARDTYFTVVVHLDRLQRNWALLAAGAPGQSGSSAWPALMPVVKADAYGHGLLPVVRSLFARGARAFALGSVKEAVHLARAFPALRRDGARLVSLLGVQAWQDVRLALGHGVVPLVHRAEQIDLLASHIPAGDKVPIAVKVDTGMSRLGFRQEDIPALLERLCAAGTLLPTLLVSHLSSADEPQAESATRAQVTKFASMFEAFKALWPEISPSLANSAGCLLGDSLLSCLPGNVARPGFALYGGNPFAGTSMEAAGKGFTPVMEAHAPILELRHISAGTQVSYGGTFTAPRPMRIAVLGAGYSDGLSRMLSGRGAVCIRGQRAPVLGRVCMQMVMVDVSDIPRAAIGDSAYILGGEGAGAVTPERLAAAWGTIPYEVFCLFGKNKRKYKGLVR